MIENPLGSFVENIFTELRNEIILRCDLLGHINVTTKDNIKRFKHTLENAQTLDANNTPPNNMRDNVNKPYMLKSIYRFNIWNWA